MKKLIALVAMVCMFTTNGIAFAQEDYALQIVFESDPKSIDLDHRESYITAEVGDEITFIRKVVSIGMDTFEEEWNWDEEALDCVPVEKNLVCTVLIETMSSVSITVNAVMDDASTREVTSSIIKVQVGEGLPAVPDYYGHPNYDAIDYLYKNDIVEGYPDGSFKPNALLTRAELMKILVLGAGHDPQIVDYNGCFPDVDLEWFAPYVCFAKDMGWVKGYEDGTFKPGENVLKVEAIKMLLEIFEEFIAQAWVSPYDDVSNDSWYAPYIGTAYGLQLLEEQGPNYEPGEAITRGQVSENIYRLMTYEEVI